MVRNGKITGPKPKGENQNKVFSKILLIILCLPNNSLALSNNPRKKEYKIPEITIENKNNSIFMNTFFTKTSLLI